MTDNKERTYVKSINFKYEQSGNEYELKLFSTDHKCAEFELWCLCFTDDEPEFEGWMRWDEEIYIALNDYLQPGSEDGIDETCSMLKVACTEMRAIVKELSNA